MTDEPILGGGDGRSATGDDTEARELVRCLVTSQPYAVLSTQAAGQPYASLVAFAVTEDLASLVFATPVFTRKYELLKNCHNVALLIDDRPQHADLMTVAAVTATGHAAEIGAAGEIDRWQRLLTDRHRHLAAFVRAPSCALFRVTVVRYFHVTRFQEVREWRPTPRM